MHRSLEFGAASNPQLCFFSPDLPALLLPEGHGGLVWLCPVRTALTRWSRVLQLQEEPKLELVLQHLWHCVCLSCQSCPLQHQPITQPLHPSVPVTEPPAPPMSLSHSPLYPPCIPSVRVTAAAHSACWDEANLP